MREEQIWKFENVYWGQSIRCLATTDLASLGSSVNMYYGPRYLGVCIGPGPIREPGGIKLADSRFHMRNWTGE